MARRVPAPVADRPVGTTRRGAIAGAGIALVASSAHAQRPATAPTRDGEPVVFALANGLQVIALPSRRAPIALQMLWYRVGSADEPPGRSGIAHFLEHLMFKGTPSVPAGQFSRAVSRGGGRDNAFTSYDFTGYHQTVASDRLELVMRMEADRMANLVVSEKELLSERDVVLEERRQRTDNVPAALLDEATREALFGRRAYGIPVIGWPDEIRRLGVAEATEFYREHYAPNNAVLVVAGDASPETVRTLAERHYGPIARRPVPARSRPDSPADDLPRRVVRHDPRTTQPEWSRDYVAPSRRMGEARHADALQVLAQLFGGGQTGRLWRGLVEGRKVALSAGAGYSPQSLGLSSFGIGIVPAPLRSIADVEAAVRQEIDRLLADGAGAEETERAKNRLIAGSVYARDSLATGPRLYGVELCTGGTVEDVAMWPARIARVTPAEATEAARAVLREERSVTSVLLPAEAGRR